jgi:hypothetical protein
VAQVVAPSPLLREQHQHRQQRVGQHTPTRCASGLRGGAAWFVHVQMLHRQA